MSTILFILALTMSPGMSPIDRAEDLYTQGSVAYEAADYDKAIELFTESLAVTAQLPEEQAKPILVHLLFNIAAAHEKAYDIDKDPKHLRQALTLYERYTEEVPDTGDSLDAEVKIARLRKKIRVLDQIESNRTKGSEPQAVPEPPRADRDRVDNKKRNVGIGLLAGGSAAVVAGVAVLASGARLKPQAEQQVNEVTGGDMAHEAYEAGQLHIQNEAKRGRIFMGIGAGAAAVGIAGVVAGAVLIKKSKVSVSPSLGSSFTGISISGSF